MCVRECPPTNKSSLGQEKLGGQGVEVSPLISSQETELLELVEQHRQKRSKQGGHENSCPPETTSVDAGSAQGDTFSVTPQGERTSEELRQLRNEADNFWK